MVGLLLCQLLCGLHKLKLKQTMKPTIHHSSGVFVSLFILDCTHISSRLMQVAKGHTLHTDGLFLKTKLYTAPNFGDDDDNSFFFYA